MENKVSSVHYIFKLRISNVCSTRIKCCMGFIQTLCRTHHEQLQAKNKWTKTIIRTQAEKNPHYFVQPCDFFTTHSSSNTHAVPLVVSFSPFFLIHVCLNVSNIFVRLTSCIECFPHSFYFVSFIWSFSMPRYTEVSEWAKQTLYGLFVYPFAVYGEGFIPSAAMGKVVVSSVSSALSFYYTIVFTFFDAQTACETQQILSKPT